MRAWPRHSTGDAFPNLPNFAEDELSMLTSSKQSRTTKCSRFSSLETFALEQADLKGAPTLTGSGDDFNPCPNCPLQQFQERKKRLLAPTLNANNHQDQTNFMQLSSKQLPDQLANHNCFTNDCCQPTLGDI